jgi:DNA-directed RNA polymerase specialized sigma24 family protein
MTVSAVFSSQEELSNEMLFRRDLAACARLSREQEDACIERARAGDADARHALIESLLVYVRWRAGKYAVCWRTEGRYRMEYLDLVQVGSVVLLEALDKALVHPCPVGYLMKAIAGGMVRYCLQYGTLIKTLQGPQGKFLPLLEVESYDLPAEGELGADGHSVGELIEVPAETTQPERDYTGLYAAVDELTERQREVIEQHYGLGCAPEDLFVISCRIRERQGKPYCRNASGAYSAHGAAIKALRRRLGDDWLEEKVAV